jgi:AraC family transcriptional regulator
MLQEESLATYRARLTRALGYVQKNIAGEVSLDGAAEAACFSKFHFHRIFSAAMGLGFSDYVRRLRLERAATFLEQRPSMTVTEIAMASGFSSPSVLSRDFAERFGAPPSRWKERRRAALRGESRADMPGPENREPSPWSEATGLGGQGAGRWAVGLRRLPAFRFASCLHIGPYGPGIQEAWNRLCRWAGPRGFLGPRAEGGTWQAAGISWDNPEHCPPKRCRYSTCIEIPPEVEPSGDILLLSFPARSYLCLHYTGSDADFTAAYSELFRRVLPASSLEPEDDPAIELYRGSMPGAAGFDLDIALPVRPLV